MPTPTATDPIDAATRSITALLVSIERDPSGPAVVAFKSALRRHGHNLADTIGPEAFGAVLRRVKADAPDKAAAENRERIVREAWQGITDARDEVV